jgi:hypothetical protein
VRGKAISAAEVVRVAGETKTSLGRSAWSAAAILGQPDDRKQRNNNENID